MQPQTKYKYDFPEVAEEVIPNSRALIPYVEPRKPTLKERVIPVWNAAKPHLKSGLNFSFALAKLLLPPIILGGSIISIIGFFVYQVVTFVSANGEMIAYVLVKIIAFLLFVLAAFIFIRFVNVPSHNGNNTYTPPSRSPRKRRYYREETYYNSKTYYEEWD